MARPRKLWSQLRPTTQQRKLRFYRKLGLSDSQVKSKYNSGTLGSQKAVRGHAYTPERPSLARKHPEKYRRYAQKHGIRKPEEFSLRDRAYANIYGHIGNYIKYDDPAVRRHVYDMMTDAEAAWTEAASLDMILGRAEAAYGIRVFGTRTVSPWWYHKDS